MAKAAADPLARYNSKRDFTRTAEPAGKLAKSKASKRIFMVQKHAATRLHYDFRLELDGVLKSWAVTRGPSLNPDDKRLAVRTEDHPMGYATFEGTIPKGEYGGGTVMLWDRGTWEPLPGKDPSKTIEEGHLHFTLQGERMKGEWILIRLKPRGGEKNENWLLRKVEDEHSGGSDDLVAREVTSVKTGRTMDEIAGGVEKKAAPAEPSAKRASASRSAAAPQAAAKPPAFREPQLATLVDAVPAGNDWIHEVKYDGYRALLAIGGGSVKAYTRTGQDWSVRFAGVIKAATQLPGSALLDGEIAVLDRDGRPSFQALQASLKDAGANLVYFVFDILEQDGEDLTGLTNLERKQRLAAYLGDTPPAPIHYADHIIGQGEKLFESLCAGGYEGVISKKANASYKIGKRSPNWLKIKCIRRQEFVIIGWSESDKGRGFRSLLLGVHEGGALRYAGKVGTGFTMRSIADLSEKLEPLGIEKSAAAVPRADARRAHWVKPELVAEIAFTEMTDEGVLRHPSFLGLREDKKAKDVVLEKPAAADAPAPAPAKARPKPAGDAYHGIKITNPDRIIYPESKITKGELAAYYDALSGPMLEWLGDRPVTLVRCPQGRAKHCFFQKHDAGTFGDHVKHVPIREKDGSTQPYLYVDDAAGILAMVQMGAIELHGWGSKIADVEKPDRLVFDLDPDEGLDFDKVKSAATFLRDALADMGLVTFPLLSGGKGVHVVAPLDASRDWVAVKSFADRFARAMAQAHADRFTANLKKVERKGRIFIDWLRNQRGATAIMPYAARARPNAPVAAPITWEELAHVDSGHAFTIADQEELLKRAKSKALKGWGKADQALPDF